MLLRVGPTDFRERTDDRDPKTAPICVATDQGGEGGRGGQIGGGGGKIAVTKCAKRRRRSLLSPDPELRDCSRDGWMDWCHGWMPAVAPSKTLEWNMLLVDPSIYSMNSVHVADL